MAATLAAEAPLNDLLELDLRAASAAIRSKAISPVDLVEAYLGRIEAVDDRLHSYITVTADQARTAAKTAETEIMRGDWRGPLHGLPYAVKDNYYTRGIRTTGGSRTKLDFVPDFNATAIDKIEAAGGILLGKLNTWEYGTGVGAVYHDLPFPLARNPWNLDHFTGGSSSGAGASVPARTALFALGSDTGGSVRLPAAACGLQGLKPTIGVASRYGMIPNCWAFDTIGPLCWNVEDCAIVADVIAGYDAADASSIPSAIDWTGRLNKGVKGLRIGVIRDITVGDIRPDAANLANMEACARALEQLGAIIIEVKLPAPVLRYRSAATVINWSESYSIHEAEFRDGWALMGQALRDKMTAGIAVSAVDYLAALRDRRVLSEMTSALLTDFDAVLAPCAFHTAPRFADEAAVAAFTGDTAATPFNIAGLPAMAICTGFDENGMPTNAQIVGNWLADDMVLRVGAAYEMATPWRDKFPTL